MASQAYATIEDKAAFFMMLEDEAEVEIEALADALQGPDLPDEPFLDRVARFQGARRNAESQVMREIILVDPEPTQVATEDVNDDFMSALGGLPTGRVRAGPLEVAKALVESFITSSVATCVALGQNNVPSPATPRSASRPPENRATESRNGSSVVPGPVARPQGLRSQPPPRPPTYEERSPYPRWSAYAWETTSSSGPARSSAIRAHDRTPRSKKTLLASAPRPAGDTSMTQINMYTTSSVRHR